MTPLHICATRDKSFGIFNLLIEHGADIYAEENVYGIYIAHLVLFLYILMVFSVKH